jgi:DNA-binding transcriptional regulator GbsR (MarR family)
MHAPFSGVFGNSNELKIIQFLMPLKSLEFNISEIARGTGVSRQTLGPIIKKLTKWNVLRIANRHGDVNYYVMHEDSGFVEAFENINNRIIEQMLDEETLAEIARCSLERQIQIQPIESPSYGCAMKWTAAAGGLEEKWSHMTREEGEAFVAT